MILLDLPSMAAAYLKIVYRGHRLNCPSMAKIESHELPAWQIFEILDVDQLWQLFRLAWYTPAISALGRCNVGTANMDC